MSTPGGPNEIGAVSVGVTADLSQLAQDMQGAAPIAEKAGEEAGKAFNKGVEKATTEGGGAKWMGEGSDGFVGPARPTGKDEAARQWALANEEAAALNAGGGGGAGAAESGGAGGGAVVDAASILAAAKLIQLAVSEFAAAGQKIGIAIGEAMQETQKQYLELNQSLRQYSQSVERGISLREDHYQKLTGANPLTRDGAVIKNASDLEREQATLTEKRAELDKEWATTPMDLTDAYKWKQRSESVNNQMAENAARIARDSREVSDVQARVRRDFTYEGLLAQEDDARGISHPAIMPGNIVLDAIGQALTRKNLAGMSDEELIRKTTILTESNNERARRVVRAR